MLITIISFIIAIIVAFFAAKSEEPFNWGTFVPCFLFTGIFLALIAHLVTWPFIVNHQYTRIEHQITASKAESRINGELHGNFFYIKGKIEEKDYYFVLVKSGDVYHQENLPVESTVIVETSGQPRIVRNERYVVAAWPNKIRFHEKPKYVDEKDTIYVPVGTMSDCVKYEIF